MNAARTLLIASALAAGMVVGGAPRARAADPVKPTAAAPAPATAPAAGAASGPKLRRFAFLAGVNDGGGGRTRLRYATSDARAVSRVLVEMGGVGAEDVVFAAEPDRTVFLQQLDQLRGVIAAARRPGLRTELIFYYSGHSDEEGLLLHGERLTYVDLRARIEQIPADVRVAVLDSCASGALTRGKGGVFRPPFMTDDSVKVKGHAFLTSSSATEVAQESDRIGASFFTHYLVTGLRGAADANRDRRVTFFEAYQFASEETLARTERTRGGAQHAAYDIQLNGTGDLVMTDVRATSAGLVLAADVQGAIAVRDPDAQLVAELRKAPGHPVELGLEPGRYLVTMAGAGSMFEASVELRAGQRTELGKLEFHVARPLEFARARGSDDGGGGDDQGAPADTGVHTTAVPSAPAATVAAGPSTPELRHVPFTLGILPIPGDGPPERVSKDVALALLADRAAEIHVLQLSLGINWVDERMTGLQLTDGVNIVLGPMRGAQMSAVGNYARGDAHGLQMASGANVAVAELHGAQLAAGVNYAGGFLVGTQLAAGANIAMAGARGVQAAAGVNWANADFRGLQMAAGFNGVRGQMDGAQLGIVNYASTVKGSQVGIVNLAGRSSGLQLGLVNIMDEDDGVPIGLFNYARKNGILHVDVVGNETTPTNLALKIGGHRVYNTFTIGARPGRTGNRFSTGLGLGVHTDIDVPALSFLDVDVGASSFTHDFQQQDGLLILSTARLVGGWRLARHFTLLAGPTLNVLVRKPDQGNDIVPGAIEHVLHDGATRVSIYPGLVAGIEI